MYSIGILLSCLHFLSILNREPVSVKQFSKQNGFLYTTPTIVESLLVGNSCIVKNKGLWFITESGKRFLTSEDLFSSPLSVGVKQVLRLFLKESLLHLMPSWVKQVYQGRLVCLNKISDQQEKRDIAYLLQELELLRETTDEAIEWWEELVCYFSPNDDAKNETGNKGERLSREYERKRVGVYPHWESKFSNLSGFDLRSSVSQTNTENLYIEVKSSKSSFVFYLTRGEWKKAQESVNYVFHFWHLASGDLYIFTPQEISNHVSINQGNGEWTVCEIELSREEQIKFRKKEIKGTVYNLQGF